jgi:hypothetical protein
LARHTGRVEPVQSPPFDHYLTASSESSLSRFICIRVSQRTIAWFGYDIRVCPLRQLFRGISPARPYPSPLAHVTTTPSSLAVSIAQPPTTPLFDVSTPRSPWLADASLLRSRGRDAEGASYPGSRRGREGDSLCPCGNAHVVTPSRPSPSRPSSSRPSPSRNSPSRPSPSCPSRRSSACAPPPAGHHRTSRTGGPDGPDGPEGDVEEGGDLDGYVTCSVRVQYVGQMVAAAAAYVVAQVLATSYVIICDYKGTRFIHF